LALPAAVLALTGVANGAPTGPSGSTGSSGVTFDCQASGLEVSGLGPALALPLANAAETPCASQSIPPVSLSSSDAAQISAALSVGSVSAQTSASANASAASSGVTAPKFAGLLSRIHVTNVVSNAGEVCVNGEATPSASSKVVGLTVNGTAYGTVTAAKSIFIPGVGTLHVNATSTTSGAVTQRALVLDVLPSVAKIGGTSITLGYATASAGNCPVPTVGAAGSGLGSSSGVASGSIAARQAASKLALGCTARKLVLIDVAENDGRVALLGAADSDLVGKQVAITFLASHKVVAHAVVGDDGFFGTTAPLPAASIRNTNAARYEASIGRQHSLDLKLTRRMIVRSIESANGQVTIKGRIVLPLADPIAKIYVEREVSCTSNVNVKGFRPAANGTFTVTLAAPPSGQAAAYRAVTRVRISTGETKTYPTATLPRVVSW
jgi:hypothetical protein